MTQPALDLTGSVTRLLRQLPNSDPRAVTAIFEVYFNKLAAEGQKLLHPKHLRIVDGEDLALSVLRHFFDDASNNRLPTFSSRHEVWRMLHARLRNRAANQRRELNAQKRSVTRVIPESDLAAGDRLQSPSLDHLPSSRTDPGDLLRQLHEQLLERLTDPTQSQIAAKLLEGFSTAEIAQELNLSVATILRKIQLIRSKWQIPDPPLAPFKSQRAPG